MGSYRVSRKHDEYEYLWAISRADQTIQIASNVMKYKRFHVLLAFVVCVGHDVNDNYIIVKNIYYSIS